MALLHVNDNDFKKEVFEAGEKVLVDFYADWCGPCKMIAPVLEELADTVKVCKVNVDQAPVTTQMFAISSIPALFVIKDGKIVNQAVGYMDKDELLNFIG